ncbi:MAG: hypothetical protein ACTSRS_15190 [Candidatus Helarchaeota archaeon]
MKSTTNRRQLNLRRAIALLSGGLDSALSAKLILDQGIEVYGLNFHSPFCVCNSNSKHFQCGAAYFAQKIGIPLRIIAKGDDYLHVIKSPKFGYGRSLNPCIDCRIHLLKKAKEYADEIDAGFFITGEVLGQRPKSQTLNALKIIEQEAGLQGRILRPLSAQYFPKTLPEEEGLIDRSKLLNLRGRRRNIQIELGCKYHLVHEYCANGGCRLTSKEFGNKVRDYLLHTNQPKMEDIKWLKIGRHFRYQGKKIICGKNQQENLLLQNWARGKYPWLEVAEVAGPIVLILDPIFENVINFAAQIAIRYSDSTMHQNMIKVTTPQNEIQLFEIERTNFDSITPYRI